MKIKKLFKKQILDKKEPIPTIDIKSFVLLPSGVIVSWEEWVKENKYVE